MRFAFLVYIGRSGSTFPSRQLDAASQDVLVTPEPNFVVSAARLCDAALRALDPDALVRFVRLDPQIRNLGLEPADLETLVKSRAGQGVRALCEALVRADAHTRGRDPRLVIVKKSVAHLAVEELLAVLPEVAFVHIRRDARGVVNSLVRTESVLDPGHRLGRGDPVHAARLWVRQQASVEEVARRHPERAIELAYEEVLRAPTSGGASSRARTGSRWSRSRASGSRATATRSTSAAGRARSRSPRPERVSGCATSGSRCATWSGAAASSCACSSPTPSSRVREARFERLGLRRGP